MSQDRLPYGRQTIEEDDLAAVADALRAEFLTTGPRVERFETAFAAQVGAPFAVACSNGTTALHLAVLGSGVQAGQAVIVPSITFLATANCARFVGADVVFADVDPLTGLMTPATLEEALARAGDRRVAAVLPVHLRGELVDMPAIRQIAARSGAVVIEDACHALGSKADWGQAGDTGFSQAACFSFHPVKTIATAEGGMITTRDAELAARMKRLRSHAMVRPEGSDPWIYEMHELGFNYRMPDLLAALGLSQLAKLGRFVERRRHLARLYQAKLQPLAPHVRMAAGPAWAGAAPHLLAVLIDFETLGVSRRQVFDRLLGQGIGTQVHYIPVHTQPYYRALAPSLSLPGAEQWFERELSLPLFPGMSDEDVDRVVDALGEALGA